MSSRKELEELFFKHEFDDFKWIDPQDIVVSMWVRMKCTFGCEEYGKNACCPPSTPSVDDCQRFLRDYKTGVVFHFSKKVAKPEQRHQWTKNVNNRLLKLERAVFLLGNQKAFLLPMDSCGLCAECAEERAKCNKKRLARPTPEALAIDVFSTVRKLGYAIKVLSDYYEIMNRYAFLLIE